MWIVVIIVIIVAVIAMDEAGCKEKKSGDGGALGKIDVAMDNAIHSTQSKIEDTVKETSASMRAISKTVDQSGFLKFFTGESDELLKHNLKSEYTKEYYYEPWLKLKEDSSFSRAIVRNIWVLMQRNTTDDQLKKYEDDLIRRYRSEPPDITRKSIEKLKSENKYLYDLAVNCISKFMELQDGAQ